MQATSESANPLSSQVYQAPLSVIELVGADAETFLHNQITQDVTQLNNGQWAFSAHCDPKGKAWSVLRVARSADRFYLVTSPAAAAATLAQLKKYAVFSKVTINDLTSSVHVLFDPTTALPVGTLEQPATEVTTSPLELRLGLGTASLLICAAGTPVEEDTQQHWLKYEIEQGVVQLSEATLGEYVPQMLRVDELGGINYKKGCYIGQETVARMHYLGQNKRALRLVVGKCTEVPDPGATLEQKLGDNWRRAGAVINAVRYDNNEVAMLVVVPAELDGHVALRIKGDEQSDFTLRPKFDNQEISNE